jgi:hypothetical protein
MALLNQAEADPELALKLASVGWKPATCGRTRAYFSELNNGFFVL